MYKFRYLRFRYLIIVLYFQGFVLFYDVTSLESFQKLDKIKKDIDKFKDKREVQ
jgi:hypothetical protein